MAAIAKSGTPSLCSTLPPQSQQLAGNLRAGEALAAGDACYIKSDGLIWKSTGAAANAAAKVDGFAAEACAVGEAVTLFFDVNFYYGAALTPGARVYLSGTTAGGLDTATSTGGTAPIGFCVDATRIHVQQSRY
jgi:hypothetical protein